MENIQKKISIKPLISTRNFLAEIIQEAASDYEKAGAIQAFEVCYELARNTMRKVLNLRDVRVEDTPKAIFRLAGNRGFDFWCRPLNGVYQKEKSDLSCLRWRKGK